MLILMKLLLLVIFLTLGFCVLPSFSQEGNASYRDASKNLSQNNEVVERWLKFEKRLHELADSAFKTIVPILMESADGLNITSSCIKDSLTLLRGVKNLKPWALSFLDSSGKSLDGILSGATTSLGSYDQCLNTVVRDERSRYKGKIMFRGMHCVLEINPPLPPKKPFYKLDGVIPELQIFFNRKSVVGEMAKSASIFHFLPTQLGICVPSGCSLRDISQLGKLIENYIYFDVSAIRCELKEENKYSPAVIFMICAFSLPVVLMLIGSFIDLYCYYAKRDFQSLPMRVLLAFSLCANFKKFASTKVSNDTLNCLNGIRFITITWIIIGHTYYHINFRMFSTTIQILDIITNFLFQAIINGTVAVDTFFCISGLLVCYSTLKYVSEGKRSFNVKLYVIHRLWRILPIYAYVVGLAILFGLVGSGPFWHDMMDKMINDCHTKWWANLLFISNFYDPLSMCVRQGWFIACDMQLYIAALIILLPLLRWPKVGLSIAGSCIIACIIYSGVWTLLKNYPPAILGIHPDFKQSFEFQGALYLKPFVHVGPYCIGMMLGYLLATRPKLQISKIYLIAGWCIAIITITSVIFGIYEWDNGRDPTFWETLFYSSCHRTAWTLGVAWVILCCATGHGGVINFILSWKIFIPISRLTFIVYLLHPYVQYVATASFRMQVMPQHQFFVWMFFGHLCVTYGISVFAYVLIEAPFIQLEKIILGKRDKETPSVTLQEHSNLSGSLKINKYGDGELVLPVDNSVPDGSDNKAFVYKL